MRRPIVVAVVLAVLALPPIAAWLLMAASLEPGGLGRSIGRAILVVLSPPAFGGLLMIVGALLLRRTRRAGSICATVGAALVAVEATILAGVWLERTGRCVDASSFCVDRIVEGGAFALYALAHVGLIVLVWSARRGELSSTA